MFGKSIDRDEHELAKSLRVLINTVEYILFVVQEGVVVKLRDGYEIAQEDYDVSEEDDVSLSTPIDQNSWRMLIRTCTLHLVDFYELSEDIQNKIQSLPSDILEVLNTNSTDWRVNAIKQLNAMKEVFGYRNPQVPISEESTYSLFLGILMLATDGRDIGDLSTESLKQVSSANKTLQDLNADFKAASSLAPPVWIIITNQDIKDSEIGELKQLDSDYLARKRILDVATRHPTAGNKNNKVIDLNTVPLRYRADIESIGRNFEI